MTAITKEKEHKTYFEYLDALRCLAFIAVFYAHTGGIFTGAHLPNLFPVNIWTKFTVYGPYGVNFFFVLSGFLITFLLLREKDRTGSISIKSFYIKRVLRIWPVFFITFFFSVLVLPFLISPTTYQVFTATNPHMAWSTILSFFFFVGNFYQGWGYPIPFSIGILWSVCVEEQFYFIWPWIVKKLNIRNLTLFTILLISVSLLYKYVYAADRIANYYLTWSVGMDLAFGALLGIYYFKKKQKQIIKYSLITIACSFALIASVVLITYSNTIGISSALQVETIKSSFVEIVRLVKTPIVDCIFTLILLYFINKTAEVSTRKSHPILNIISFSKRHIGGILTYLGKISYGLYAYHTICFMLTVQILSISGILTKEVTRVAFLLTVFGALLMTIIVAHASSIFIERKILNLKNKLN